MTPTTVHRQSVSATREAKKTDRGNVTISNMSEKTMALVWESGVDSL